MFLYTVTKLLGKTIQIIAKVDIVSIFFNLLKRLSRLVGTSGTSALIDMSAVSVISGEGNLMIFVSQCQRDCQILPKTSILRLLLLVLVQQLRLLQGDSWKFPERSLRLSTVKSKQEQISVCRWNMVQIT